MNNNPTPDRRERYAAAIHDAMEPDLSLVDQEPGMQALFARAAEASVALADAELAELRRKMAASERIRENADFHLGQEMARRQLAEKEAARLSADRAAALRDAAEQSNQTTPNTEPINCGLCLYGSDVGVPGYDDQGPAYTNPACPDHSPEKAPDVCICGHTEQQHFEDVCVTEITGCDCGDYMEPSTAREVIDRWRTAALKARAEGLTDAADFVRGLLLTRTLVTTTSLEAELRRMADEAQQQPDTETQAAEDPARIDRLRPEFTDHASIESIDVQLRRARSQQRRWHLRVEWLISLRQARVMQKELGEWPVVVSQPGKEA